MTPDPAHSFKRLLQLINFDKLNNLPLRPVAQGCMTVIDRLQRLENVELQIAAAALTFREVCRVNGVSRQDIMQAVDNMATHAIRQDDQPEFRALQLYCEHELKQ